MLAKLAKINLNGLTLEGNLVIPEKTQRIVLFAHGSGSSRFSPRNNFVAEVLQKNGLATLLFDLLTEKEDTFYQNRFDIDLLTERLILTTQWVKNSPQTEKFDLGYFGASTGAAAALKAASKINSQIKAIVCRGGRPDLVMDNLKDVKTPTLLIVGGEDFEVIKLNQLAFQKLTCPKKIEIIEGATHLFEEEGALEKVAELSAKWFRKYFKKDNGS